MRSSAVWRGLWIALRRARIDRRARHALFAVGGVMALFVFYGLLLGFFIRQFARIPGGGYFYAAVSLAGMVVGLLWRRSQRRADEMLGFSITGREPSVSGLWKPNPDVVKYMVNRAEILSTLILRGMGEVCIHRGAHTDGAEPRVRQAGNAALRSAGLWDELTTAERDLMSSPDGAWTVEQASQVVIWREQLRLLRWILGMDSELEPIDHLLPHNVQLHWGLWKPGDSRLSNAPKRIPSDARGMHDFAQGYYLRVLAEITNRGLLAMPADGATHLEEFRQSVVGNSSDFLTGHRTVAELRNDELPALLAVAGARMEYAGYIAKLLSADAPFPFRLSSESAKAPDSSL